MPTIAATNKLKENKKSRYKMVYSAFWGRFLNTHLPQKRTQSCLGNYRLAIT